MNKLRIMLIDDNPDDRTLTIHELRKEFDIQVNEIIDAKSFSKALHDRDFDIVITDYQLRWTTGLKILGEIKKKLPECPVIMFTGTGNEQIAVEAMKAGLDDYVIKSPKHFVRIPAAVRLTINRLDELQNRKRAEKALFESEEKFKKIFESSPNAIIVSSLEGNIIECNPAMLELYRYPSKEEIVGKNVIELISENDQYRASEYMKKILYEGLVKNVEYTFLTKDGRKFPAEFSAGVILDLKGKPTSYVALTKDITEQKHAEEEMKKRTMKYKLEDGNLYLTKESIPSLAVGAFKDILKIGYYGIVVSRTLEVDFRKKVFEGEYEYVWLAEKGEKNFLPPKFKEIEQRIENLPRKNAVLMERMDYLIFKNSFNKTLTFIQHLRELAYLKGNIIIISIDPSTLNKKELRLLEKESKEIETRFGQIKMPEVIFKILKFIQDENMLGVKPSFIYIGRELNISKPTVRKRVKILIAGGYLFETINGRNKALELTEMGRNFFSK